MQEFYFRVHLVFQVLQYFKQIFVPKDLQFLMPSLCRTAMFPVLNLQPYNPADAMPADTGLKHKAGPPRPVLAEPPHASAVEPFVASLRNAIQTSIPPWRAVLWHYLVIMRTCLFYLWLGACPFLELEVWFWLTWCCYQPCGCQSGCNAHAPSAEEVLAWEGDQCRWFWKQELCASSRSHSPLPRFFELALSRQSN